MDVVVVTPATGSLATPGRGPVLPEIVAAAGDHAGKRFVEFFTATIRNGHTRRAYARACGDFFAWCEQHRLTLAAIEPVHVAAYIEAMTQAKSAPTVKQALAAIGMLFDYLVTGQIVPFNPAAVVRGPKHVVKRGKTPVLRADEARQLLDSIDTATLIGLRDRALIGVMVYSFARVEAALGLKVADYYIEGRKAWFRLHEKNGKRHEVPAHHNAADYLEAYLATTGIADQSKSLIFRSIGRDGGLTHRPLLARNALHMIKRRAVAAGLSSRIGNHTFRATGITAYLENGGTLEHAQRIAAHESPKTTKLYDRTSDQITLDEVERIAI
jgi:site-specific recombinase XerD